MKTGTIKYSAEFRTPDGFSRWAGIELEYDMAHETPANVYKNASDIVHSFIQSNGSTFSYNSTPESISEIKIKPEDREIGLTVEDILSCSSLKVLTAYQPFIAGKSELEDAYNQRYAALTINKK